MRLGREDIETLQLKENAMETKSIVLLGAAALSISVGALAGKIPATVVSVHYSMQENDPETLEKNVLNPVMRSMQKLDGVMTVNSIASHGSVDLEVGFLGDATAQDLAAVTAHIERLKLDEEVAVLSRVIELRPARSLLEP